MDINLYKGDAVESISKFFFMENVFHVIVCIFSPEICKKCLRIKYWSNKTRAKKKAHSRPYILNLWAKCAFLSSLRVRNYCDQKLSRILPWCAVCTICSELTEGEGE